MSTVYRGSTLKLEAHDDEDVEQLEKGDATAAGSALAAQFRRAMRQLAGGVCAITVENRGRLFGIAATSVISVSIEPSSILVSVAQASFIGTSRAVATREIHIGVSGSITNLMK
jgi:hypothetical protein